MGDLPGQLPANHETEVSAKALLDAVQGLSDPLGGIVSRHRAGTLTIADRKTAVEALSILQDLIAQTQGEAGPGGHPTSSRGSGDPTPAEQLSDSEFHSLMAAARSLRASISE